MRLLYEEAIQRQWSSATDIPWETIEPLPDDIERAMCQMCTFLTEVEFIAGDAPGQWMPKINSEYHEVKLFLLTQINDEARHLDVFRKRALANGGGLLEESVNGPALRIILEAQDFTEMSSRMPTPRPVPTTISDQVAGERAELERQDPEEAVHHVADRLGQESEDQERRARRPGVRRTRPRR